MILNNSQDKTGSLDALLTKKGWTLCKPTSPFMDFMNGTDVNVYFSNRGEDQLQIAQYAPVMGDLIVATMPDVEFEEYEGKEADLEQIAVEFSNKLSRQMSYNFRRSILDGYVAAGIVSLGGGGMVCGSCLGIYLSDSINTLSSFVPGIVGNILWTLSSSWDSYMPTLGLWGIMGAIGGIYAAGQADEIFGLIRRIKEYRNKKIASLDEELDRYDIKRGEKAIDYIKAQ